MEISHTIDTILDSTVLALDFNFKSASDTDTAKLSFKDDRYSHIVGFASNTVNNQSADIERFSYNGKDFGFGEGVGVNDILATIETEGPMERYHIAPREIERDRELEIKLKDTTPLGDFTAHTRKIYVFVVKYAKS